MEEIRTIFGGKKNLKLFLLITALWFMNYVSDVILTLSMAESYVKETAEDSVFTTMLKRQENVQLLSTTVGLDRLCS